MTLLFTILNSKFHIESKLIFSDHHIAKAIYIHYIHLHTIQYYCLSSANLNSLFSFLFIATNVCTQVFKHTFLGIFTKSSNYNAKNWLKYFNM